MYKYSQDDYDDVFKILDISDDKEKYFLSSIIHPKFLNFYYKEVRQQPISSFIRAIEVKCRKLAPVFSEFFNIYYEPMLESNAVSGAYLLDKQRFEWFRISLPKEADEEKNRCIVAHEIGHLYCAIHFLELKYDNPIVRKEKIKECRDFLIELLESGKGKKYETFDKRANVIGVFILSERSNFYKHKIPLNSRFFCKTPSQIAGDFKKWKKM